MTTQTVIKQYLEYGLSIRIYKDNMDQITVCLYLENKEISKDCLSIFES